MKRGINYSSNLNQAIQFNSDAKQEYEIPSDSEILDMINDAIIGTDKNFLINYWNKAAEKTYGWSAAEVIGKEANKVLRTEFLEVSREDVMDQLVETGNFYNEVIQYNKKNQPLDIISNVTAIKDESNFTKGYIGINRNITQLKATREMLAFKSHALSQLKDAVIMMDNNNQVTYWNHCAERISHLHSKEVIGKPFLEIYDFHWTSEEDEKSAYRQLEEHGYWKGENIHLEPDGKKIYFESTISKVKSDSGEFQGTVAVIRDVTEKKHLEEKLKKSEERYRLIVEKARSGIFLIDSNNRIKYVNKKMAEMLGYIVPEMINKSIFRFVDVEGEVRIKNRLKSKKEEHTFELPFLSKDGSQLWALLSTKLLFKENGEFLGALSITTDITARKGVEQSLMDAIIDRDNDFRFIMGNMMEAVKHLMVKPHSDDYKERFT
jgi:PAS domain S-box-containing protein